MQAQNLIELLAIMRANKLDCAGKKALLESSVGNGIYIKYETTHEGVGRVLLTTNKKASNTARLLNRQCNGTVLDFATMDVVSFPVAVAQTKYQRSTLENLSNDYQVYEINDGTTVTLYNYDGKWCLSTANGYSVGNLKLMGDRSYFELFKELANRYLDFDWNKLDSNMCYTIGFRHHDYHPLQTDPEKMWLIQTTDLSLLNCANPRIETFVSNIGIPTQNPLKFNDTFPNILVKLRHHNKRAAENYHRSMNTLTPDVHYGYILRANNSTHNDIILESSLYQKVKNIVYNYPSRTCNDAFITPTNRMDYIVLRALLDVGLRYDFLSLFPNLETKYKTQENIFDDVAAKIQIALQNKQIYDTVNFGENSGVSGLTKYLLKQVENCCQINPMDPTSSSIIRDIILDKRFLEVCFGKLYA